MKNILLILGFCFIFIFVSYAQQNLKDVVYLKNGSIIKGIIIEQKPGKSIKIQTDDGNVFVYEISDIERMIKEPEKSPTSEEAVREKNPLLAAILSGILPGIGQYYNGNAAKGAVMNILYAGGFVIAFTAGKTTTKELQHFYVDGIDYSFDNDVKKTTSWYWIGFGVSIGTAIWSIIDAALTASSINRELRDGSNYGHMFEKKFGKTIAGLDLNATPRGYGASLKLHF